MNTYELTVIAADKSKIEAVGKVIAAFVKKAKGEINKEDSWGQKTLAYSINKNTTGHYMHYVITLDPSEQPKLDAALRIEESLLRYLFVKIS